METFIEDMCKDDLGIVSFIFGILTFLCIFVYLFMGITYLFFKLLHKEKRFFRMMLKIKSHVGEN